MSPIEIFSIWELFGLFALDSIFTPFYAACVVIVAVYAVGKVIRGRMV